MAITMKKNKTDLLTIVIIVLVILALYNIIPVLCILLIQPKGFNLNETKLGNIMREIDNQYHTTFVSWISYFLLTLILSYKIMTSKTIKNKGVKTLFVLFLLLTNYLFVFPLVSLWNVVLSCVTQNKPVHLDKDTYFPQSKFFEEPENFKKIQDEIKTYVTKHHEAIPCVHDYLPILSISSKQNGKHCWHFLQLKLTGHLNEKLRDEMPFLFSLLQDENISTAAVSILDPGMSIPKHRGYFKGYIRYHIGIDIPTDKSPYIVCGGEKYEWKTGEGVLFDDTYIHYVENPSCHTRIVLYLDVKRKNIPPVISRVNDFVQHIMDHNFIIQASIKNQHMQQKLESI